MKVHMTRIINTTRNTKSLLRPILGAPGLPITTKLKLYRTYVLFRITYAAPAWYSQIPRSLRRRLQAQQNLALCTITKAPRCVRNTTLSRTSRMESIETFVKRIASNMFRRADSSSHSFLKDIAPLHSRSPDHRRALQRRLLPRDLISPPPVEETSTSTSQQTSQHPTITSQTFNAATWTRTVPRTYRSTRLVPSQPTPRPRT